MSFLEKVKDILPLNGKKKKDLDFEETQDKYNNVIVNKISPDSIKVETDYVRSGDNYTRTLVAVTFKPSLVFDKIMNISEISENVSIVQHVSKYDNEEYKADIAKSIRQNNAKLNEPRLNHALKARAKKQIQDAEMILEDLESNNENMFYFNLLIHIVASSLDELQQLSSNVKSTIASTAKVIYPHLRAKDAFDSFMPLNKNKVSDLTYRPMSAEAVANFFPFHENEIFEEKGIVQGRNLDTNNVLLTNDESYLNKHICFTGTTGAGKSTAIFSNMMRKYMFGNRIIVIDPKGEFGNVFTELGGEHVSFRMDEKGSVINPFDLPVNVTSYENTNPLFEQVSTLTSFFRLMYIDMTDLQEDVLAEVMLELYADDRFGKSITKDTSFEDLKHLEKTDYPLIKHLYQLIEEKQQSKDSNSQEQFKILSDFHQTLRGYAIGIYSNLFNGYTNVDTQSDLICYDIFSVYKNKRLDKPLYFLLLSSLRNEILKGDKRSTMLYIDEAHIIADPKVTVAMEYLYEMMKVVRSFNCGIATATQSIKDFLSARDENRNYGEAVLDLSMQQVVLPLNTKEIEFINNEMFYDFSEQERQFLQLTNENRQEKAGKGFLFVGNRKMKIQVELTDLEKKLWIDGDYSPLKQ